MKNKNSKLTVTFLILIFILGIIIKYNYMLLNIFMVNNSLILLGNNIVFLLLISIVSNHYSKTRSGRFILIVISILFSLLFYTNLWYNRYFGNYLSFVDMLTGIAIRPKKVIIRQLFNFTDLPFIFDNIVTLFLFFKLRGVRITRKKLTFKKRQIALTIILVIMLQISLTGFYYSEYTPGKIYEENPIMMANAYGIIPLYAYEFYNNFKNDTNLNYPSNPGLKNIQIKETEEYNDITLPDDTNVLILQLESYDARLVDYTHNGVEVSPFINNLKEESIYFDNVFAQHINGSFDAEVSVLTSTYPVNKNYSFKDTNMSNYESLVNIFNKKGYETAAYHGNNKEFFSRDKGYSDLNYDNFISIENYSFNNNKYNLESYFGINDYDFLDQSVNYIKNTEGPFFNYLITVTSHTPFYFYPKGDYKQFSSVENRLVRDYFRSIRFLDDSLNIFFTKLKKEGILDNTLVVVFSDHSADIRKKEYNSNIYFESNLNFKKPEKSPVFMYHPKISPKTINKVGTLVDIGPTILSLLGKDKPHDFLGNSLLNNIERPAYFLHEVPQILYNNQLFLRFQLNLEDEFIFENIANIKGTPDDKLSILSKEIKEDLYNTIKYTHRKILNSKRDIEE